MQQARSTIKGYVPQANKSYVNPRNTITKLLMFFQSIALLLFNIAMFTDYWNYDEIADFNQGLWVMYKCPNYDLNMCTTISFKHDDAVLTLRILFISCYTLQILGYVHTFMQYFKQKWYTYYNAIISITVLTTCVFCLAVGFAIYIQRSIVSNFALHIQTGYSAHCAIASGLFLMLSVAVLSIEVARRSPFAKHEMSIRQMKHMIVRGLPPERINAYTGLNHSVNIHKTATEPSMAKVDSKVEEPAALPPMTPGKTKPKKIKNEK